MYHSFPIDFRVIADTEDLHGSASRDV